MRVAPDASTTTLRRQVLEDVGRPLLGRDGASRDRQRYFGDGHAPALRERSGRSRVPSGRSARSPLATSLVVTATAGRRVTWRRSLRREATPQPAGVQSNGSRSVAVPARPVEPVQLHAVGDLRSGTTRRCRCRRARRGAACGRCHGARSGCSGVKSPQVGAPAPGRAAGSSCPGFSSCESPTFGRTPAGGGVALPDPPNDPSVPRQRRAVAAARRRRAPARSRRRCAPSLVAQVVKLRAERPHVTRHRDARSAGEALDLGASAGRSSCVAQLVALGLGLAQAAPVRAPLRCAGTARSRRARRSAAPKVAFALSPGA